MAQELEVVVKAPCAGEIEWKVEANQQVMEGHIIGEVVNAETKERISIIAPCSGTWQPNATSDDQVLGKIQACSHDLLKGDLCMICLTRVTKDEQGQAVKVMFSHGQSWHMTREAARTLTLMDCWSAVYSFMLQKSWIRIQLHVSYERKNSL